MRILITGGTGLIGRKLGEALVADGHQVVTVSRNPDAAKRTLPYSAEVYPWDGKTLLPKAALDGVTGLIHLAGESIAGGRWTKDRKQKLWSSRTEGTGLVFQSVKQFQPSIKTALMASAIGYYGDGGDQVFTEDGAKGSGFLADLCEAWEKEGRKFLELGIQVRHVRIGLVLAPGGGFLKPLEVPFRLGLGGAVGNGKQWMSWIHIDDLVRVFKRALQSSDFPSVVNGVSPNPTTNREFSKALAEQFGKRLFLSVPSVALKLAMGEMAELALSSQRVTSKYLKASDFQYPDLPSALRAIYGRG